MFLKSRICGRDFFFGFLGGFPPHRKQNCIAERNVGLTNACRIVAAGCALLFLPAYLPDLNPIEHLWAAVKTRLRKDLPAAANPALFVGTTCLCYC